MQVKIRNLFLVTALTLILASLAMAEASASAIAVNLNNKPLKLGDAQPFAAGKTVMLPLKAASQALGANVSWNGATNSVTILRGDRVSVLKAGQATVSVNGKPSKLSAASQVKNGVAYVPQDFIEAVFGFPADFNQKTKTLNIKMKELPVYFSKSFKVKYLDNGCKLITDGEGFRIMLVPPGTKAPKGYAADKTIYGQPKRVLACSSTFAGAMARLNLLDRLKGVSASEKYWYNPAIKNAVHNGSIKYIGGDNMEDPDYELVKSLKPDLVFIYTGDSGQQYIIHKLDEMGINYAVDNEYLESDCLKRMEWIKFIAAFFDRELAAEKMLNDAVKNINVTTARVEKLKKPKVAWGLSWAGKVYTTDPDSYVGQWITMCGGDYVYKNLARGADTQVNMEDFYARSKDADLFIFSSTTNYMIEPSIQGILQDNPLFANIKAVKAGNVWAYAPDWWEDACDADTFVADIAAVFHPEAFPQHKITKLVKLPPQ